MPRKVKTAFTGSDTDRALTGIHDVAFIARERDGVKGFELRIGGGTSIMPRIAPTLIDFVRADDGEYLKYTEAVLRIFDRQDWLRVNRARARIKVLVDKVGIEEVREMVEEELQGDWVAERDFSIRPPRCSCTTRRPTRPAPPHSYGSPNGDGTEFARFRDGERRGRSARTGFSRRPGQGRARRPHARAVPRARRRSCASSRAATPAPPCTRTCCCAGCATRRSTTSGGGSRSSASATPAPTRSTTSSPAPAPTRASSASRARWASTARCSERIEAMNITDPLTRRIHIKMSGCPNGCSQHHIGNIGFYGASIKVGEHTIPAYVAHIGGNYEGGEIVYGARLKVRLPAKRVPEAVERWIRKYEAEREDGEVFNAYADARRHQGVRGRGPRPRHAGRVRPGDDERVHRLDQEGPVPGHPRRGRVRGLMHHLDQLEAEAIHVIREVAAELEKPVLLFSGGKDSIVLLHLARKAFRPGDAAVPGHARRHRAQLPGGHRVPRPRTCRTSWSRRVQESIDRGRVRDAPSRNQLQTTTLLDAIEEHGFDAAFGGARRDEERARAKERVFSFRDDFGQWDPRRQRPELWDLYNGRVRRGRARARLPAVELDRAGRVGVHPRRGARAARRSTSRTSARCSSATGCSTRSPTFLPIERRHAVHGVGALPHRGRHDVHGRRALAGARRSTT